MPIIISECSTFSIGYQRIEISVTEHYIQPHEYYIHLHKAPDHNGDLLGYPWHDA